MRSLNYLVAILVAASSATALAQPADAKKLADQLSGNAKAPASSNPQCKLFGEAEMAAMLGMPVGPGENVAGGAGCSWHDKAFEALAIVTVVPSKDFPEFTKAKGFKRLPNLGKRAWIAPDDGWTAGTVEGDVGIVVVLSGEKASEAAAIALLQEVVKRRGK
jgi:hypothetical protein